ncbi:MAG: hypothetical protein WC768_00610 [Patescibacteria group bacterium]|jgi:hypothetical protein
MGALLESAKGITGHTPLAAGRLASEDFVTIEAQPVVGEPDSIAGWTRGFGSRPRWLNECQFRDHPLFGRYRQMAFLRQSPVSQCHFLAVADSGKVHGQTFDQQAEQLPENFQPISAVEAIAAIFAYQRQDPEGKYPDFGWGYFWCRDVVKLQDWPEWYCQFRGITTDHRIALRVDPEAGIIIVDFPVSCCKSWVDWATPDLNDFATIAIGATTVA